MREPNGYLKNYTYGYMVMCLNGRMYIYIYISYNPFPKRHPPIRHIIQWIQISPLWQSSLWPHATMAILPDR